MLEEQAVDIEVRAPEPSKDFIRQHYPAYLILRQVQIIHRHGERTPIGDYLPSFVDKHWTLCHQAQLFRQIHAPDKNLQGVGSLQKRIEEPGHFHAGLYSPHMGGGGDQPDGTCFYGQLTDKGRSTHFGLGLSLRKLYVDALQFMPSILSVYNQHQLYIRTTQYPRTEESVQHLISGLYQSEQRLLGNKDPIMYTRFHADETLFGDSECKRWRQLVKEFKDRYLEVNQQHIQKLQDEHVALAKDTTNLHAIYDTLVAMRAHGMKLPNDETDAQLIRLEKHVNQLWFKLYQDEQIGDEAVRLSVGRLIQDIKDVMKWNQGSDDNIKMAVYSTHDSTIGPLLGSLKISNDRWPAFASNILLELLEDTRRKELFVRTRYNGESLELTFCDKHPKHPDLCSYSSFWKRMNSLIPQNYKKECQT